MSDQDDFRRTIAFGESAIGHLRVNEVPAYPRYYELWYTYASAVNTALNRAINDIIRSRGRISSKEVSEIFDEFIAPNRLGERIEEIGGKIGTELTQTISAITQSVSQAERFGGELQQGQRGIDSATDRAEIAAAISQMMSATRATEAANRQLAEQLVESRQRIEDLQQGLEAIRFESMIDDLTTLANRKHFEHTLMRAVNEAEQSGEGFSLIMTDIDHFKKFNDTYGHQTGDQVLRLVAIGLKQNVKGQDVACRYGGEEFGVVLPRTGMRQALVVAEHIRLAVMAKELVKRSTGENLGRITISVGVATWRRGDAAPDIVGRADAALYAAKRAGRNLVRCESDPDVSETEQVA